MDLVIKNLTEDQSNTIAAFAHAAKNESVGEWIVKYKKEGVEKVWGTLYKSRDTAEKDFHSSWGNYGGFKGEVEFIKIK